ncbi:hypothetical protein [Paenibacillus hexagrammi]|uniref:Uncharacterized protein n=1 Tax=Paenibacillus hexagrammi TaxID=2908839 RepID=A0ABY3SS67_9BACL|nr:hypothetical protein [Paenibacillus sp. YPD9-1]UJF36006.1 hypothetical protein L0M14_13565 [Paenibacillus sp. YPD9-1]
MQYDYFNLTDAQLRADHVWTIKYPAAKVSFDQTLLTLADQDTDNADFYHDMYTLLGYKYVQGDYTAKDRKELTSKLQAAVDAGDNEVTLRYARGASLKSDLKKAMSELSGVKGISYSSAAYTRTVNNDQLITVTFTY